MEWKNQKSGQHDHLLLCADFAITPFLGDRKVITEGLIKGGDWRYQYPHSFPTGIGKLPEIVVLGAISKEDLIDSLLGLKIFKADLAPYRIVLVVGRDGKIAEAMKTMFIKDEAKVLIMAPYEPRKITKYSPRYADYIPGAYPGQIAR